MPSRRKVYVTQLLEWFFLIGGVVGGTGVAIGFAVGMLSGLPLYASIGSVGIAVVVVFWLQYKLDSWIRLYLTHNQYADTDAFDALYERSPVAYLTADSDGVIHQSNGAAINMLEANATTIVGTNFFQFLRSDADTEASVLIGKVKAGLTINDLEVSLTTTAGNVIWAIMSVFTDRQAGERLISLVDVTEQKQVDTAKSEFVALATHQLRTPIAAIRWNVELLEKNIGEVKTESQDRYLEKINRNVIRMVDLINDFLSVSKLEMGTYAATEERIDLTNFFSSIIDEFSEKIAAKQLAVDRQDQPPHVVIKIDRRLFHIIVSNLVSNAVKYLKPSGTLYLAYTLRGDTLEIEVADNGIGIPSDEIPNLFTKFYRASNAQTHHTQGTGLGLYIVQQSAERLGGTVAVTSQEGEGTRFVISLPARVVSEGEIS